MHFWAARRGRRGSGVEVVADVARDQTVVVVGVVCVQHGAAWVMGVSSWRATGVVAYERVLQAQRLDEDAPTNGERR